MFAKTAILSQEYCNIVCGCFTNPNNTWLMSSKPISNAPNATMCIGIIDDAIEIYDIKIENVLFINFWCGNIYGKGEKILQDEVKEFLNNMHGFFYQILRHEDQSLFY